MSAGVTGAGFIGVDGPVAGRADAVAVEAPYLIEVVAPIESETKAATLAEIRGDGLPADRVTLKGLSDAVDHVADDITAAAKRYARRAALIYG